MAKKQTLGYTAKPSDPLYTNGKYIREVLAVISITAAAAVNDVHVLAHNIPIDAQVVGIFLPSGSAIIAGLTDVDFGFHRADNDAALDTDVLADGVNFSAAARASAVDLIGSGLTFDTTKNIGELLSLQSDEEPSGGVNVTATIKAEGAGTGTIPVLVRIAFPA